MIKGFALGGGALVGVIGTPIGLFIAAGFYKIIMMFMSNDTPYMKILSIYLYANLVYYIGGLLNVALGFVFDGNGVDVYTSLAPLFEKGTVLHGIGSSIEIFNIWSLVLTGLGLHIVAGLSKKQATTLIVIFFVLSVALGVVKRINWHWCIIYLLKKGGSSESPFFIFTLISNATNKISNSTHCNFKFQRYYLKLLTVNSPLYFYIVEVPAE